MMCSPDVGNNLKQFTHMEKSTKIDWGISFFTMNDKRHGLLSYRRFLFDFLSLCGKSCEALYNTSLLKS